MTLGKRQSPITLQGATVPWQKLRVFYFNKAFVLQVKTKLSAT